MSDKEMLRLAKKFKGWSRPTNNATDLWLGDDYAFGPQGFSKAAKTRSDEALSFCAAAPEFILRLLDHIANRTIEDVVTKGKVKP